MADADVADTGVSEDNLLGDNPTFVDADGGEPDAELASTPEEAGTAEAEEVFDEDSSSAEDELNDFMTDAEAAFLSQEEVAESEEEDETEDEPNEEELKGAPPKLQKRLRDVISQRNEIQKASQESQERLQQYEQWEGQARQQYTTLAQQAQAVVRENQRLKEDMTRVGARLDAIEKYGPQANQQPDEDDYVGKFRREVSEQTLNQLNEKMDPRIQQLEGQITQMQEASQKREQAMRSRATRERIINATEEAAGKYLFPDGYPDDIATDTRQTLTDLVIAHSYGTGKRVEDAAQHMSEILRKHGLALLRAHGVRNGKKLGKSQKTRSLTPANGQPRGNGKPRISQKQAKERGFTDALDAAMQSTGLIDPEQ